MPKGGGAIKLVFRCAALCAAVIMLTAGCKGKEHNTASATAYAVSHGGPLTVEVTVGDSGAIESINITEINDLAAVGGQAAEILVKRVLEAGSTNVDVVSGATVTSMALLSAIDEAAEAASARLSDLPRESRQLPLDTSCEVLVIGGGGAGLMAACRAAGQGADVLLCEKLSIVGGSTAKSRGGIAFYTEGVTDRSLEALHPLETVELLRGLGVEFMLCPDQSMYAAIDRARGITTGSAIVMALAAEAERTGVRIMTDAKVTGLVTDADGAVTGAIAKLGRSSFQITARSVIICTGGDAASEIAEPTGAIMVMSSVGSDGSGISMAGRIGADTVKTVPLLAAVECDDPDAGILVTGAGLRFANECGSGADIAGALLETGDSECWFVSDRPIDSPSAVSAPSIEELAELIKTPELKKTVDEYNACCRLREDAVFNKPSESLQAIAGQMFYAERRAVVVYGTVGGLRTDQNGAVLSENGIIANLYAAGEASNVTQFGLSYEGEGYSLAQVFYSALLAGDAAAANAAENGS